MDTRRFLASISAAVVLAGVCAPALAQNSLPRRLSGEQKLQLQVLSKLVDEVAAKQHSAPADVALSWQSHFLKADKGLVYVPYTVGIDGKFTTPPVGMYVRVLLKDTLSTTGSLTNFTNPKCDTCSVIATEGGGSLSDNSAGPIVEDIHFFEPPKDGRLSRAFWLPPGDYDVFVAMQERPAKGMPKSVVLKQPLAVPDLSKEFTISSLMIADSIEPATRALNQQQQVQQPYSIGGTKITPASTAQLRNRAELIVVFFVYNPTAGADNKPDVQVGYTFLQKAGEAEQAFTAAPKQLFNAQTLPAEFNLRSGHQLMAGQSVPLASFPAGEYRLQVTVTDNLGHASTTGDVSFSVLGQ